MRHGALGVESADRMPVWNPVETELTTAATDALLGVLCVALAVGLVLLPTPSPWKRNVWIAVLACMAVGSLLGAVAHGVALREATGQGSAVRAVVVQQVGTVVSVTRVFVGDGDVPAQLVQQVADGVSAALCRFSTDRTC